MSQSISLLPLTRTASGAVAERTFVDASGATATAAANALGAARYDAADGEDMLVDVLGTAVVLSAAAIADGAALEVGTDGKAVTQSAGVTVARALQAAAGADEPIEVLLIAN